MRPAWRAVLVLQHRPLRVRPAVRADPQRRVSARLPVELVGNGGGYGYGVMGATHQAMEDYGVFCALQNMRVHVPAFADDLAPIVARMAAEPHPAYLRLGRWKPKGWTLPDYAPRRRLLPGRTGALVAVGPGAGGHRLRCAESTEASCRHRSPILIRHQRRQGAVRLRGARHPSLRGRRVGRAERRLRHCPLHGSAGVYPGPDLLPRPHSRALRLDGRLVLTVPFAARLQFIVTDQRKAEVGKIIGNARPNFAPLLFLGLVWAILSALTNPVGNFP